MTLHELCLLVHSYLRWVVVLALVWVIARSVFRGAKQSDFDSTDERGHALAVRLVDIQFMFGLVLYVVLSPLPRAFIANPAAGMQAAPLRFFGMEHALGMLIGTALVHVGRNRSLLASTAARRHRLVWAWTLCGLLVVLVSIPWPGRASGRPLFRGLGAAQPSSLPTSAAAAPLVETACPPAYQSRCAACHGNAGRGDGPSAAMLHPTPRDLSDAHFLRFRSDEALKKVIVEGGASVGLSAVMPAHPDLGEAEIGALVRCIRGFERTRR